MSELASKQPKQARTEKVACQHAPTQSQNSEPCLARLESQDRSMPPVITAERPDTPDAVLLIGELQTHLESFYPPESRHGFSVERLIADGVDFFVLRVDGQPAGCGGIKLFGREYGELKRMYVRPQYRGSGSGQLILDHLANFARAQGVNRVRLETGIHQKAAIRLYEQNGFHRIPPFGPYFDDPVSLCYEKKLS
jgi:GNAT superfamily N-acetyltransferase